ncbi:YopX family protein [Streptococcus dysgalactiae]|uniref:YopX family protein n=1 Tax=Streptococcus dysgalactiae TaxID=1334 RepID=UPI0035D0EA3F
MIPKFRVWNAETKAMYEVKSLVFTLRSMFCVNRKLIYPERTFYFDDENICLMQSTGLFDKNGVEIFDGDIVNFMVPNQMISGTYQIRQAKSGEWRLDNRVQGRPLYISGSYHCEVIGNVWENPELLERG